MLDQSKSSLEAAAEAAAKVNALLIANGKLSKKFSQPEQQNVTPRQKMPSDEGFVAAEVEINDVPSECRNYLTHGHRHIAKISGASVSTRGRFMTPEERINLKPGERPLYLFIRGPNTHSVETAVQQIMYIIESRTNLKTTKVEMSHSIMALPPSLDPPPPTLGQPPPSLAQPSSTFGQQPPALVPPPQTLVSGHPALGPQTLGPSHQPLLGQSTQPTLDPGHRVLGPQTSGHPHQPHLGQSTQSTFDPGHRVLGPQTSGHPHQPHLGQSTQSTFDPGHRVLVPQTSGHPHNQPHPGQSTKPTLHPGHLALALKALGLPHQLLLGRSTQPTLDPGHQALGPQTSGHPHQPLLGQSTQPTLDLGHKALAPQTSGYPHQPHLGQYTQPTLDSGHPALGTQTSGHPYQPYIGQSPQPTLELGQPALGTQTSGYPHQPHLGQSTQPTLDPGHPALVPQTLGPPHQPHLGQYTQPTLDPGHPAFRPQTSGYPHQPHLGQYTQPTLDSGHPALGTQTLGHPYQPYIGQSPQPTLELGQPALGTQTSGYPHQPQLGQSTQPTLDPGHPALVPQTLGPPHQPHLGQSTHPTLDPGHPALGTQTSGHPYQPYIGQSPQPTLELGQPALGTQTSGYPHQPQLGQSTQPTLDPGHPALVPQTLGPPHQPHLGQSTHPTLDPGHPALGTQTSGHPHQPHLSQSPQPLMSISTQPPGLAGIQEKLFIGMENAPPELDLKNKILGIEGSYLNHIITETGARVTLRGQGSGFLELETGREALIPLHLHIQHETIEGFTKAKQLAVDLIATVLPETRHVMAGYSGYHDYSSDRVMSEAHETVASVSLHPIITPLMNADIYGHTPSINKLTDQPVVESQLYASRTLMGEETTSGLYHGYGREMGLGAGMTHTADVSYNDAMLKSQSVFSKKEYGIDINERVNRSVKRKTANNMQAMKRFHGDSSEPSQVNNTFTDLNSLDLRPGEKLRFGVLRVIALLKAEVNGYRLTDPRLLSKIVHDSKTGLQIVYSVEPCTIVDSVVEFHSNVFLGRLHIGTARAHTSAWVKKRAFGSAVYTLLNKSLKTILMGHRKRAISTKQKKCYEDVGEEDEEEVEEEDEEEVEDIPIPPCPVTPTTQPDCNDVSVKFDALKSRICKSNYETCSVMKLLDGYTIQSCLAPVLYYSISDNKGAGGERFCCDLCMDDVSVSAGEGADLKAAQLNAYIQAWVRFTTESVTQILEYSPRMTEQMKHDSKYVEVFQKGQKEFTWTNTLLLESHHPEGPNLARSLSDLVVLETEEWAREGAFSVLNNSAAKCGLLMEWVFQKEKNGHSRCNIYIQKQQLGTAKDVLRYQAREQASMNALEELYESRDFIQEYTKDPSQIWYAWDRLQIDARMSAVLLEEDTMSDHEYQQITYKKEAIYACNVVHEFFSNDNNDLEECIFDPSMPLAEQRFIKYYVTVFLGLEVRQKTHTDGRLYLAVSKIIPLPEIVSILKQSETKSVGKYCLLSHDGVSSETYASFLIEFKTKAHTLAPTQSHTQSHFKRNKVPDLCQQLMESPPTEEISEKLKTLTTWGILWFTNLHEIKQMYGTFAEQDLERPPSELVLMENETSANQLHSAFLNLRTSASKCGILIDWSVEKKGRQYECCLYIQKNLFSRGSSNTKAMDACLEAFYTAVVNLYQTHPVIQITQTEPTRILWQELQAESLDWEPEPMDEFCLSYDDSTKPLKYRTETMYTCSILRDFFQDRDKRYEELELKDIPAEVETIVSKYAQSELNCCHRKKKVAQSFFYQYSLMSSAKDLLQAVQKSKTAQVGKYRLLSKDESLRITARRKSRVFY